MRRGARRQQRCVGQGVRLISSETTEVETGLVLTSAERLQLVADQIASKMSRAVGVHYQIDGTFRHYRTNSNFFQCFSRYVRGVRGRCFRPLPPASGAPRPLRAPFSPHKCRNCGRIPRRASAGGAGGRPRSGHAWPSFRLAGGRYFRPLPHASGDPACGGAP